SLAFFRGDFLFIRTLDHDAISFPKRNLTGRFQFIADEASGTEWYRLPCHFVFKTAQTESFYCTGKRIKGNIAETAVPQDAVVSCLQKTDAVQLVYEKKLDSWIVQMKIIHSMQRAHVMIQPPARHACNDYSIRLIAERFSQRQLCICFIFFSRSRVEIRKFLFDPRKLFRSHRIEIPR